ncbi:TPA: ABC transporter ATP-binding protein [Legionella pneumophila]|uniref:ABC transporter ATP-binding protein n=1 Tax=Legionella pneumophila TaxID=446 RepID=UPI001A2470C6|nr:ABC transporter ATP-binding protein [Legionella pneumophila]HAT1858366.1 ABC transporter ATP-binding protein [Legionella pneumophila]HAT1871748.1 ABC transporter ATP-binding protein [Legionella pneumophila]HAU1081671.1 ABC transporter ATP-binding protein [Legionella pneumophila]HAU1116270.1 ABC transporter ATP-binding protein [Legionella pneumophila]
MSWILRVDNLSKIYRLGAGASQHGTIYEQVSKKIKKALAGKKAKSSIDEEAEQQSSTKAVISDEQKIGLPPGHFWALKDINFQISPGERIGLIGQNGSGKSTLLKILSRITTPTYGEFRYKGHLISLLEVGTGFHPELTGRENIYLNAAINGMTRQQINLRFKDIVEFSELGSQIETPVKRYSSGMYMRLAFSVAAFLESEILLIDEVLAVGDQDFQKKCKEKMLEVANDGRTVIFVSHDMNAVESICKKIIKLSHGSIVEFKDIEISKTDNSSLDKSKNLSIENEQKQSTPITLDSSPNPNESLCSEKNWNNNLANAPQIKDTILIYSLKLLNHDGQVCDKFTVNEDITIQIQYEIKRNNSRVNIRLDVSSLSGVNLFSTLNNSLNPQHKCRKAGFYSETLVIPKEFLNEGQFLISLVITDLENNRPAIVRSNCLSMKVIDDKLPIGVRGDWLGVWPDGLLRPKLTWSIKSEESSSELINQELLTEE